MIKKVKNINDVPQKPHYVIMSDKLLVFGNTNERYSDYQQMYYYVTEDYTEWVKAIETLFREEPDRKGIRFYEATYFPKVTITVKVE